LANDITRRATELGNCDLAVVTQHAIFDMDTAPYAIMFIDEAFTLPAYHVYAIANMHSHVVIAGDHCQLSDMAMNAHSTSALRPMDAIIRLELPESFTVPQDVMRFGHERLNVPTHWFSSSPIVVSMFPIIPGEPRDLSIPTISGSRDCAQGTPLRDAGPTKNRTIFTSQGQRFREVIYHICLRDSNAIDSNVGWTRSGLHWTMITRHTEIAHLDFCGTFLNDNPLYLQFYSQELADDMSQLSIIH